MKKIGIVAEYNPFHGGHRYLIEESRRLTGEESAVISVMSGDFVQRGEPAILDKFTRAEEALKGGSDLVLELPLHTSLSSAEGFAQGAIRILSCFHVDTLAFGSETGDADSLREVAELMSKRHFVDEVKQELKRQPEQSYAAARQTVAERELRRELPELRQPNNILAVEYLRALTGSGVRPLAVKRVGAGHDEPGDSEYPSASELRKRIREEGGGPDAVLSEALILDRLRRCGREDFPEDGLGDSIWHEVRRQASYEAVIAEAASRRYPLARVRRTCLRAILGVNSGNAEYIRVLGFNQKGREILRKGADLPLLIKAAKIWNLSDEAKNQFLTEASAHDFYQLLHGHTEPGSDWRHGPVIAG